MKKIMTTAVLALVALGLTGCQSEREVCEEAGGTYVKTGSTMVPVTTYIPSGSTNIPITNYYPVNTYSCEGL